MKKLNVLKKLSLVVLVPFLAGCALVDNIIANIALNMMFGTEFIVNKINIQNPEMAPLDELPTSASKRLSVTYGLDVLAFPKAVEIEQFQNFPVSFSYEFSEPDVRDLFFETTLEEGGDGLNASLTAFYPLGSLDKPATGSNIDDIQDFVSLENLLIDLPKEPDVDFTVKVTGKVKEKTKSETYYFKLTTDGLPTLEIPDEENFDADYLIYVEKGETESTSTFSISKEDLIAGADLPLQVAYINFEDMTDTTVVTYELEVVTDLSGYDVTLPSTYVEELTINQTLSDYPLTIKKVDATTGIDVEIKVTITAV